MNRAIGAAQQMLSTITPKMCADYVAAWRWDLDGWAKVLANLQGESSIEGALKQVGLR